MMRLGVCCSMLLLGFHGSCLAHASTQGTGPEGFCKSDKCERAITADDVEISPPLSLLQVAKSAEPPANYKPLFNASKGSEWILLSETASCEDNSENIERLSGDFGFTLNTCKAKCVASPTCEGIDYYTTSGWCNLYDQACSDPTTTKDGASSYRLQRKKASLLQHASVQVTQSRARWSPVSETAACEDNDEGVQRSIGDFGFSLASCKAKCMSIPTCEGIDFFKISGWCNIYPKMCSDPRNIRDGASSYFLQRKPSLLQHAGSVSAEHSKHSGTHGSDAQLKKAIAASYTSSESIMADQSFGFSWVPISETASCEDNKENIKLRNGEDGLSLALCKAKCMAWSRCEGIDYYRKTGWCNIYDKICTKPLNEIDGASSYRVRRKPSLLQQSGSGVVRRSVSHASFGETSKKWMPINWTAACEENTDGIKYTEHSAGFTFDGCKNKCEQTSKCVAIDFYSESGWCLLYDKVCKNPRRIFAGSSSHQLVYKDDKQEAAAMVQTTASFPTVSSTVHDVSQFMVEFGSPWAAAQMSEDQIDGEAFLLLTPEDLKDYGMKRGPALKLSKHLEKAAATVSKAKTTAGSNALHEVVGPDGVLLLSSTGRSNHYVRTRRRLRQIAINTTMVRATDAATAQTEDLEHGCPLEGSTEVKESCKAARKTGYGCASKAEQAMAASHLKALLEAKKRNRDWTAIFEDNVRPVDVDNWSSTFRKAWKKIPPHVQMVRLGWCQIDVLDYPDPVVHEVHSNVSGAILTQRIGYGKFSGKPFFYEPGGCTTAYMVHKDILPDLISLFPCCGSVDACYKWDFMKQVNPKSGVERGMEVVMNIDSPHHQLVDGVIEHHGLMVQDADKFKLSMLQKGRSSVKVNSKHSHESLPLK